ncbi:MAG: BatA domain-containing protein [Pirellulales bacterium]
MPSFVYESLLWWGLPLVGLPVLIHLINLMRHRRVKWAAMEFLLQSQKRHRKSVLLKQLLLLLLRMLAVAAVVLMVAQPLLRNKWGAIFGGSKTHHIVIVDDSFSMSDHWADTSAFDQAKQVVARLAVGAERQDTPQIFTLLRFSRCRQLARGTPPDLLEEPLDADFMPNLEKTLGRMHPSQTAAGPAAALEAVDRLPPKGDDEDRLLYIVSDFRAGEWQEPVALRKALARLGEGGAQIHLISCVEGAHENLAIAALRPAAGTRAAGVPLLVEVTLRNFGPSDARGVSVSLEEDGHARPPIVFEEVPAGKIVTRRFPVLFATAGQHEIVARLQSDAVAADNNRALVVDVPKAVDVLVIDGDAKGEDAFFLATALTPGGKVTSGLRPLIESPGYLRDHPLDPFETIYLLNIARLDAAEISALEGFVKGGGGLGIFMGELSRAEFFNDSLYRGGQGLFPLPLSRPEELLVDRLEKAPDLEVTKHPIFSVFAGERNSFLSAVVVNRYFAAEKNWVPEPDSSTRVIARLRNKAPLVVERVFGDGRVVVFLTKASPLQTSLGSWNNWGRDNPSFVVAMHELQSYLSALRHPETTRLVGTPLVVPLDVPPYLPQVRFILPRELGGASLSVDAAATESGHTATLADTDTSGIYQAHMTSTDGSQQALRFALNVVPDEGNLKKLTSTQLAGRLEGVRYEFHEAGDIHYNPQQLAGLNLGESLLYALIVILLAEQVLAYACSYHPRAREGRA